jgi:hypothetical protein
MAVSGFWRSKVSSSLLFMGAPAEVQSIGGTQSLQDKIRAGHGVLLGDFNEANGCGEVTWVGVVEGVDREAKTLRVNWRPADITLKPTASGASFWRRKDWFAFAPEVVDRYMLSALFADVFDDESWATNTERVNLVEGFENSDGVMPGSPIEPHSVLGCAKPSKRPRVGYVYLVWSEHGYKIGKSVNVRQRTRLFSVKLPFPIRVEHFAKFSDYSQAEKTLHDYFHEQRLDGEWFQLSEADIELIKSFGEPQSVQGL